MDNSFRRYSEVVLAFVGIGLIAAGIATVREPLSVTLVIVGAGLLLAAVFADRIEGPLKVGPHGFEAVLISRVREVARRRGASEADELAALKRARKFARSGQVGRALSGAVAEALAEYLLSPEAENAKLEGLSVTLRPRGDSASSGDRPAGAAATEEGEHEA